MPVEFTPEEHAIVTEVISDPMGLGYESKLKDAGVLTALLSKSYYTDFNGKVTGFDSPVKQVVAARIPSATIEQVTDALAKYAAFVTEQASNKKE